jgi:hypothetical protein
LALHRRPRMRRPRPRLKTKTKTTSSAPLTLICCALHSETFGQVSTTLHRHRLQFVLGGNGPLALLAVYCAQRLARQVCGGVLGRRRRRRCDRGPLCKLWERQLHVASFSQCVARCIVWCQLRCGSCHAVLYVPPPLRCAVSANDRERPRLLRHAAPLAVAVAAAQCGHYTRCSCTVPHSHCETVTAPRSACKRWRARPKARPGLSGVRASAGPRRRRRQRNIQMQHAQYNVDALVIRCDIYAMHSARERSACAARFAQQLSHRGHPSLQHRTAYCRRNGLSTKRHCDSPVSSCSTTGQSNRMAHCERHCTRSFGPLTHPPLVTHRCAALSARTVSG